VVETAGCSRRRCSPGSVCRVPRDRIRADAAWRGARACRGSPVGRARTSNFRLWSGRED